ncbi:acetylxylan esterase [Bacteroidota bacterium]
MIRSLSYKVFTIVCIITIVFLNSATVLPKRDILSEPLEYKADDFDVLEGVHIIQPDFERDSDQGRRFIQLEGEAKTGIIKRYFFGESARYDLRLEYEGKLTEQASVIVFINDCKTGEIKDTQKSISGIDIQSLSTITLEIRHDSKINEKYRIEKLILNPVGSFSGVYEDLREPRTFRVFESMREQQNAREMLERFIQKNIDSLFELRKAGLESLKTQEEWRARQIRTRDHLHEIFGEFPQKTPLNARIVGKIEYEGYVIEKLIFESQPNYFCTANVYVPKGRKFPVPGILITCGHAFDGKAQQLYHSTALGLVSKGYLTLVLDPMGQGERSEYFDPLTKEPIVRQTVSQHIYAGRPAYLVGWTLSGLRTWDCIRAVDYLVSRTEVDSEKLGVVGNSGGGQMALLTAAVDERIKVCVASHPGGEMENSYLLGRKLIDREVLSLIPPRPCRFIVGNESGEEPNHHQKLKDMQLFYEGLAAGKETGDMEIVQGRHDMQRPKREAAYEWFNKWLDKEIEGKAEPPLKMETVETLRCTESGFTLVSLGGETGQTLNAKKAEKIYKPEKDSAKLKEKLTKRIGFNMPEKTPDIQWEWRGTISIDDYSVIKFIYKSEAGIIVPALLYRPKSPKQNVPVIIHVSDKGKPKNNDSSSIPVNMIRDGYIVLSIDVRGIGETDPSPPVEIPTYGGDRLIRRLHVQWRRESQAIRCKSFDRTLLAMRSLDVIRAIDFIKTPDDLKDKRIALVGEGVGGLWTMLASVYDSRAEAVVSVGTLASYKMLVNNQYYRLLGYFWVPGALYDYDIPDIVRLASGKKQLWIDPVNELNNRIDKQKAKSIIGDYKGLNILTTNNGAPNEISKAIVEFIK